VGSGNGVGRGVGSAVGSGLGSAVGSGVGTGLGLNVGAIDAGAEVVAGPTGLTAARSLGTGTASTATDAVWVTKARAASAPTRRSSITLAPAY
jgi:hypothetical protein